MPPSTNRLIHATSPYLLQHAHNPVDWYPWGDEALQRAQAEDKPIFLSIGYSACHWCHVMERESFENESIAALLNADFIAVKVDREERPDLDDIYMGAVQALAGRGGWPMSVWLSPDRRPFYAATYLPPVSRHGMPGFATVLRQIAAAWHEHRDEVLRQAEQVTTMLTQDSESAAAAETTSETVSDAERTLRLVARGAGDEALAHLRASFDARWGGFGHAPKFPPLGAIELIFRRGNGDDLLMATRTLDAMWEGGMYDHLGGGFCRYSVDERWLVPHFEKMLYDNAQNACVYLSAYQLTKTPRYATIARQTLDYLRRDMNDEAGGFYSSEDADSEGEEGKFYVFSPKEVCSLLGEADGALFGDAFGIAAPGTVEHGGVLHRFSAPADLAARHALSAAALEAKLDVLRAVVLQARSQRTRPHCDDKVLAVWNGLALSAFAKGYQVLGDAAYAEVAAHCAEFLHRQLWHDGTLLRTWRAGRAHTHAFLDDYGALANGLVDLYEASFEVRWLRWAEELVVALRAKFEDNERGGFFFAEKGQTDLLVRQKPFFDASLPSANALAIQALLRVAAHLERDDFAASAKRALDVSVAAMSRYPMAVLALIAAADRASDKPHEIVVSGARDDPRTQSLLRTMWQYYQPHCVRTLVDADPSLPLHRGRAPRAGTVPVAYVCIDRLCLEPVATPETLAALLMRPQI